MGAEKAAKRRLLDIDVGEVSVVGSPAIEDEFVLVKSTDKDTQPTGSPMDKIKAALAEKGMTLEQLAKATGIDLEKLTAAMEGGDGLAEEDLTKIAESLEMEKLEDDKKPKTDDPEEEPAGKAPEEKQEPEEEPPAEGAEDPAAEEPAAEGDGGTSGGASMHKQLLMEKLEAIKKGVDSIGEMIDSGDAEDVKKKLWAISDVIWQLHGDAEIAVLTKSADSAIRDDEDGAGIIKAVELLSEALTKVKEAIASDTKDTEIEKATGADGDEVEDVDKLKKEIDGLRKKVAGLEKSGTSKSLPDDDGKGTDVKKSKTAWDFLSPDIPE
jgi:transcriptional regulator with XRE-family HTH domain